MRRKSISTAVAALAVLGLFSSSAWATAPTIVITNPSNNQVLEFTSFPQTINVAGTISRDDASGGAGTHNLCGVQNFMVVVSDGVTDTEIGTKNWTVGDGCPVNDVWSFPYEIAEPGVFSVTASGQRTAQQVGEDEIEFTVEWSFVASFPAAPSVAGRILHDSDESARYGSGKTGGNHISDVARSMGPGTDFNGIRKSNVAAYRAEVCNFLLTKSPAADVTC